LRGLHLRPTLRLKEEKRDTLVRPRKHTSRHRPSPLFSEHSVCFWGDHCANAIALALRQASEGKRGCEGNCRWSRGSDPRLLRLTLDRPPDHACGERPRGSKTSPYLKARLADSNVLVLRGSDAKAWHPDGRRRKAEAPGRRTGSDPGLLLGNNSPSAQLISPVGEDQMQRPLSVPCLR
jgi:hypothetical protein